MKLKTLQDFNTEGESEPEERSGRTAAPLGPSDSSDSASDLLGLDGMDDDDPNVPVVVALREDGRRSLSSAEALNDAASDTAGTGEGRSAGADAGVEAADIGVDRVFEMGHQQDGRAAEDEDPDLAGQAVPGHGLATQDPHVTAQVRMSPAAAERESKRKHGIKSQRRASAR